jgi:hypothetical protein
MLHLQPCDYTEWIDEVKLSPTLSPKLDEEYKARCDDEDMDHTRVGTRFDLA